MGSRAVDGSVEVEVEGAEALRVSRELSDRLFVAAL